MTNEQFMKHLRSALYHLYEPDRLRQNPLAALFGVANRLDTFSVLHSILIGAIESLEPEPDEPPDSCGWEIYEPLFYRYVQQLTQSQVAKQLGMSVRHLRRKEHAALEVLASRLFEQLDLETKLREYVLDGSITVGAAENNFTISEDLAWLKNTPPESPADLDQILAEVVHWAGPVAAQHAVGLEVSVCGALPRLAVHSLAISQTLLNLVTVAIHCASGGKVSLSATPLTMKVEIQVRGVKSPAVLRAFSGDDATSLDLAQQMTSLCGGRLTLLDDEKAFSAVLSLPALEQLPVLVIDDNADTLQLLQRYSAGTRYRLITTQEPEQALSLAEKVSPYIIVVDVMMPRVDGWKVLEQLRRHPLTQYVPVLVCTILAQEEMAFALGASGFLRKPVRREAFLAALDQMVDLAVPESR